MYAVTAERLKSIGWQYFEESGMFSNSSHAINYTKFWNEIEKIIKLQIVSEFNADDKSGQKDIDEDEERSKNGKAILYHNIDPESETINHGSHHARNQEGLQQGRRVSRSVLNIYKYIYIYICVYIYICACVNMFYII